MGAVCSTDWGTVSFIIFRPLTEFEEAVPGETELLPWFGDDRSEPLGDRPGVHGRLEGAEHEVQCTDVVLGFLGNVVFQTA